MQLSQYSLERLRDDGEFILYRAHGSHTNLSSVLLLAPSATRPRAETLEKIPEYPHPGGPQKQVLLDLERVIRLYGLSYGTRLPELIRHRESVRNTILDRCRRLLLSDIQAA